MMKPCLILGGGVSGRAARRLAETLGMEAEILSDPAPCPPEEAVAHRSLLVTSPGVVPLTSPLWQAAARRAERGEVEFISELEFGFRHLPRRRCIAITGTNGKTTTTELACHLLNASGVPAVTAGNIGVPLSDIAADMREGKLPPETLPVVEVSSFQLERADSFAPVAAALLNLESDHINRYAGGFEEYCEVKRRIFRHVPEENRIFGLSLPAPRRVEVRAGRLFVDGRELIDTAETRLHAPHNQENLAAAVELALRLLPEGGVFRREFTDAILSFEPGRHRIELVAEQDGIRYVNDSKATNPASVLAALRTLPERRCAVLLLGGLDKGMDFTPLLEEKERVRFAVLYGACRAAIAAVLDGKVPFAECGNDFEKAVEIASAHALPGDTVLLSPACASMDMFRDYKERGDRFAAAVHALLAERSGGTGPV